MWWFQLVLSCVFFFVFFFFSFFLFWPRAWSLRQHRLFAAPDISKFSDSDRSVSAGRCWNRSGCFPIAWFVVYPRKKREKSGLLCYSHHGLASTQIAVFCVIGIFMDASEGCGDFPPTTLKHAFTRPTSCLVWLEVMFLHNALSSLSIWSYHLLRTLVTVVWTEFSKICRE